MKSIAMRSIISLFVLLGISFQASSQTASIKIIESGKRVSIRGLSVVNDAVIWASGSNGSVARSTNGGNSFIWIKVPGYEKMDFRDIEAFDSNTAIIMGITQPAVILKTKDGGKNWKKVFEDTTKGAFLDAMDFYWEHEMGVVIGDPLQNNLAYELQTIDSGNTWKNIYTQLPGKPAQFKFQPLFKGEAFFASSGTNIGHTDFSVFQVLVSGGTRSRIFWRGQADSLPIMQGLESTGANSIAVFGKKAVVVGGDFARDTISRNNCVLVTLTDSIKPQQVVKLTLPETFPHGYRSCVIYLSENKLLTCGTSGIDLSKDGGLNWELLSKESFHVCQKAKKGNAVFLAGSNGKIARLVDF